MPKVKLLFRIGDKVTYNDCLFHIKEIDHENKKYLCKGGLSITFNSQHIWKIKD